MKIMAFLISILFAANAVSDFGSEKSNGSDAAYEPTLMSVEKAIDLVNKIDSEHNILPNQAAFDEFVPYFLQMEKDFVNNVNVFAAMRECRPSMGMVNYGPSVDQRFETFVSTQLIDDTCHYMSKTKGVSDVSICTFSVEDMTAASEEGVALYKKAYKNINQGVHTDILGAQPVFKAILSPENCEVSTKN